MGIAKVKFINGGKLARTFNPNVALAGLLYYVYNITVVLPVNPFVHLLIPTLIVKYLIRLAMKRIRHYSEDGPFSNILICRSCNTLYQPVARMYKNCSQLLDVEGDESICFAGEIEKLNGYLKPIRADARMYNLLKKGYFGHEWLFHAVESWRISTDHTQRFFRITGDPGVGKSAFATWLTHSCSDAVIAAQFVE